MNQARPIYLFGYEKYLLNTYVSTIGGTYPAMATISLAVSEVPGAKFGRSSASLDETKLQIMQPVKSYIRINKIRTVFDILVIII